MSVSSEQDLLNALEYRVHIVRLWGRTCLDGFQFVYKHESTGALLDGSRCVSTRVDMKGATNLHEFTLYPNEYIVAVRGRAGMWTDALELKTVCNRVFRVGGNGGQPFELNVPPCSEVRFLVARANRQITNVQPWVSSARYTLPEQVTNSFYQLVLRHPAFRVSGIKMWCSWGEFAGLQVVFQRRTDPFDMFEGTLFGEPWCCDKEPDVSVILEEEEYVMMTLCRLDKRDGIMELRLRTSHGRNISCGNSASSKFAFACHTLANCEVRGLRSAMMCSSNGRYHKLEMHEIRRTVTFDAAEFDAQFAAILMNAVSPEAALATGLAAPPAIADDECDDIDFEDEMFEIPETVYKYGIPSIEDVENCKWELGARLMDVRRNGDECQMIVDNVLTAYDKIVTLHNRQIAYAGLLVLRLLELLKHTVSALEKSSSMFRWSGRGKRMELFSEIQSRAYQLMEDLERFTSIEAKFAKHALTEGKNDSLEGVISDAIRMGDWQTARTLYFASVKKAPMETARDTLLISAIREDNLESFVEILRASPGGDSSDQFQINQDGRTLSLTNMFLVRTEVQCDSCNKCPIVGNRFRSIRLDDFVLCEECCPLNVPSPSGPFALSFEGGGMRFLINDSLLSVAVSVGAFQIVEWLVCRFGSDPFAQTMYACNVVALCDSMYWLDDEKREKIQLVMTQYKRRRDFQSCTSTLMKHSQVSYDDIMKLVPCITSVYDLRTVFTFGNAHLEHAELKRLLVQAFNQILTEKLVLDDDASLFFDLVLDECKKRELLNQLELMRWSRDNVRVNMENAPWVKAIKENIRNLTEQVDYVERQLNIVKRNVGELQNALIAKEEAEIRRQNCKRIVSFLSMGLCMVAGPVFEQCFHAMVDYAVPIKLLMATIIVDEEKVVEFVSENAMEYVFKDGVETVLLKAEVDSADFVKVLLEVVKLEQGDIPAAISSSASARTSLARAGGTRVLAASVAAGDKENQAIASKKVSLIELAQALKKARIGSSAVDNPPPNGKTLTSTANAPSKGEIVAGKTPPNGKALAAATSSQSKGRALAKTLRSPSESKTSIGTTSSTFGFLCINEEELDLHEYHHAVFHSEGDLEAFMELLELVENLDSVNDEMEVQVIHKGVPQRVSIQPQVLASYMGYAKVAEHFFKQVPQLKRLKPKERKITTLTRAKKAVMVPLTDATANHAA